MVGVREPQFLNLQGLRVLPLNYAIRNGSPRAVPSLFNLIASEILSSLRLLLVPFAGEQVVLRCPKGPFPKVIETLALSKVFIYYLGTWALRVFKGAQTDSQWEGSNARKIAALAPKYAYRAPDA